VLPNDYILTVLILVGIWIIVALGLNVITGYAGQFNLGIGIYMGTGAYTTALLSTTYGLPFSWSLSASLVAAAVMGIVTGLPALRVREDFLAVTTIGMVFVFESLLVMLPYFGGPLGIGKIPAPAGKLGYVLIVVFAVAGTVLVTVWLQGSWVGLAWQAIREDELAASVVGLHARRLKLYAFGIGASYAGLGGVLYAHFIRYVTPYDFGFLPSVYVLAMVVFGGLGTIRGPIVGAAVLTALPEIFRFVQEYRNLIYGAVLVVMMLYQPRGLLADGSRLWQRLRLYTRPLAFGHPR